MNTTATTNRKTYQIGTQFFTVELPSDLPTPPNMSLFLYEGPEKQHVNYTIRELPFENAFIQNICTSFAPTNTIKREDRIILQNGPRECRLIYFHGADIPYGIYREHSDDTVEIWIDSNMRHMMIYDTIFLSLFSLEKYMLRENALILHCAYMQRNGKAILFSAPSGTGKSTQADLWEKYRGTTTVNGDKSLLYCHEDGWYAHGWPICGSSEICHNESYPIEAIVMLHQAKENTIEPLRGLEPVKKLMAQVTINMWNSEYLMKAMDLIEGLVREVPVFELGCDISEGAVECLESMLD